jgi:hypothetical protein
MDSAAIKPAGNVNSVATFRFMTFLSWVYVRTSFINSCSWQPSDMKRVQCKYIAAAM